MVARVPRKAGTLALAAMAASFFVLMDAGPASAADLSVTNTADPGDGTCGAACTLREAITASNGSSATDTVNFDIPDGPEPGLEVSTISPTSQLPVMTDSVTIDGYTQAGAIINTTTTNANSAVPKIELNGTGTDANGLSDLGNGEIGVCLDTPGNTVGGTATGARNVISGNAGVGASMIGGAGGNTVQGNFVGTNVDGEITSNNLGNFHGVAISDALGNTVGGTSPKPATPSPVTPTTG